MSLKKFTPTRWKKTGGTIKPKNLEPVNLANDKVRFVADYGSVELYYGATFRFGLYADATNAYFYGDPDLYIQTSNDIIFQADANIKLEAGNSNFIIFDRNLVSTADRTYTFPDATGIFLLDTATQNVTNKKFGANDTNYASFAADGELSLTGTARVVIDHWIGASGIRAPGSKPPTFTESGIKGVWQFGDESVADNQEAVSGTIKIPSEMDRTVVPIFKVGWSANGVSPGVCEWQLEYLWMSPNDDTTAAAQETLTATGTASSTSNGLIITAFAGIDLPGATDQAMFWRLKRLSATGSNDTISDTVEMHGNLFSYTANKLGTAT